MGKAEYGVRFGRLVVMAADRASAERIARLWRRPVVTRQVTTWKEVAR